MIGPSPRARIVALLSSSMSPSDTLVDHDACWRSSCACSRFVRIWITHGRENHVAGASQGFGGCAAKHRCGRLPPALPRRHVLINNAGIASAGITEAFTADQAKVALNTNIVGLPRTNRAVSPCDIFIVFCIRRCVQSCCPSIRCAHILRRPEHMPAGSAHHEGTLEGRSYICLSKWLLPKPAR
jgi:hypothetical protein